MTIASQLWFKYVEKIETVMFANVKDVIVGFCFWPLFLILLVYEMVCVLIDKCIGSQNE